MHILPAYIGMLVQ